MSTPSDTRLSHCKRKLNKITQGIRGCHSKTCHGGGRTVLSRRQMRNADTRIAFYPPHVCLKAGHDLSLWRCPSFLLLYQEEENRKKTLITGEGTDLSPHNTPHWNFSFVSSTYLPLRNLPPLEASTLPFLLSLLHKFIALC